MFFFFQVVKYIKLSLISLSLQITAILRENCIFRGAYFDRDQQRSFFFTSEH